jgi:hypothetical protein
MYWMGEPFPAGPTWTTTDGSLFWMLAGWAGHEQLPAASVPDTVGAETVGAGRMSPHVRRSIPTHELLTRTLYALRSGTFSREISISSTTVRMPGPASSLRRNLRVWRCKVMGSWVMG